MYLEKTRVNTQVGVTEAYLENSERLSTVNYFLKKLQFRCMTGYWITEKLTDYAFV